MHGMSNVERQAIYFRMAEDLSELWYLASVHLKLIRAAQRRLATDCPDFIHERDERLIAYRIRELSNIRRLIRDELN